MNAARTPLPLLPNHWSATIARNISLPYDKLSISTKPTKLRLLTVTRRLSNKSNSNPTSRTMGRPPQRNQSRSEEHTSELQSHSDLVCRLLLEKKKKKERT